MYNKFFGVIVIVVVVVVAAAYVYLRHGFQQNLYTMRYYPEASNYTFYPISELKKSNLLSEGKYNTRGYVVMKDNPCVFGARCDTVWISENNKEITDYKLIDTELEIRVDGLTRLQLGRKYNFSVEYICHEAYDLTSCGFKLIGFSEQKEVAE